MVRINNELEAAAHDRVTIAQANLTAAQGKVDAFEPQGPFPSPEYLEAMRDAWRALTDYAEAKVAYEKTLRWKALLAERQA